MFNKTFTTSILPLKNYYFNFYFYFPLKQKIWSYTEFDLTIHLINFFKKVFFFIFRRAFIYLFLNHSQMKFIRKKEKVCSYIRKKYNF